MISVTRLRAGMTFKDKGGVFQVVEYRHVHLSRGSSTIKVKVRSLKTGVLVTRTYRSGDQVEEVGVERKKLQYLYRDDSFCFFMEPVGFEQVEIPRSMIGEAGRFLREGGEVEVLFFEGQLLAVDLPIKMKFRVRETAPGVKGNTAANAYKAAVLENGSRVKVPLFIKVGDVVKVDTRVGEYVGRVRNNSVNFR